MANDTAGRAIVKAFEKTIDGKHFTNLQQAIEYVLERDVLKAAREYADERLNALCSSFYRVAGAAASIRAIIVRWHIKLEEELAAKSLQTLERRFSHATFLKIKRQTLELLDPAILRETLLDFPNSCHEFSIMRGIWTDWLRNEHKKNTAALLARHANGASLRFLGDGYEGAVFTDGQRIFKRLHHWHSRRDVSDTKFLPSLCAKKSNNGTFPALDSTEDQGDLIVSTPYEKSVPYRGGYGHALVRLLAEGRRNGVVFHDIRNENLRRKGNTVQFIDYGKDIRPFSGESDFDLSVRKAWLCWRWGWREDIRALLTKSLHTRNMPELSGYEVMKVATARYAAYGCLPDDAVQEVMKNKPRRVFDYGCGKGKEALSLAANGYETAH